GADDRDARAGHGATLRVSAAVLAPSGGRAARDAAPARRPKADAREEMSLRSAPERTREGGRRRSARDVSKETRRSCAARKPAVTPRRARRCDGAAAPA